MFEVQRGLRVSRGFRALSRGIKEIWGFVFKVSTGFPSFRVGSCSFEEGAERCGAVILGVGPMV